MFWRLALLLSALIAVVYSSTTPHPWTCPDKYGLFPDPDDCHSFYECNDFAPEHFTCPDALGFVDAEHECDYVPSCK